MNNNVNKMMFVNGLTINARFLQVVPRINCNQIGNAKV